MPWNHQVFFQLKLQVRTLDDLDPPSLFQLKLQVRTLDDLDLPSLFQLKATGQNFRRLGQLCKATLDDLDPPSQVFFS